MTNLEYDMRRAEYDPRTMIWKGIYCSLTSKRISASWQERIKAIEENGWQEKGVENV